LTYLKQKDEIEIDIQVPKSYRKQTQATCVNSNIYK